jgi:allophanate hydrolase subunit 1
MDDENRLNAQRLAGADAISAKAVAIGAELGVPITECVWDIGQDLTHEHAHRLDLVTAAKSVRLYFRDRELTAQDDASCMKRVEDRLRRAIAQLLSRPPEPTYAFR